VLESGEELAAAHVLAAHHPIVVEQTDLDVAQATLLDDAPGIAQGLYIPWFEHANPCVLSLSRAGSAKGWASMTGQARPTTHERSTTRVTASVSGS